MSGRPREFDVDAALDKALKLFWRKGYEGTSLSDLTATLGITRPSLYAAFGNKEELFRKALDRYEAEVGGYIALALASATARGVAEQLLRSAADAQTGRGHAPGCLMVQSSLACGDESQPLREETLARRATVLTALTRRFERAKAQRDLPSDSDPAALARYLTAVINGMAVEASGGASRADLERVIEMALSAWPRRQRKRR
jgi:AcrR family transcriptional regulator